MFQSKFVKKIGIAGWWGGKNTGDEYIQQCLKKAFENDFKVQFIEVPFDINLLNIWKINRLDFLIIGGGGLFTKSPPHPFEIYNLWENRIKVAFGFLGIGVQEVNHNYQSVIRQLIEKSQFFVVRDSGSYDLLNSISKSSKIIKAPDLSFLFPSCFKKNCIKDKIGVNLRIWDFDKERTYNNDEWSKAINDLEGAKKVIPLSFKKNIDDRVAMDNIKGIKNNFFIIDLYEDVNIMIGMRLHSLIFAIQNHIPIIGIAYTPKIERLFDEIGIREFCLKVDEYYRLKNVYKDLKYRHYEISEKLKNFNIQSNIEVTKIVDYIKKKISNRENCSG